MPLVTVESPEGTLSAEQRQKLVEAATNALLDIGVLQERINVIFKDAPRHTWAVGGTLQSEEYKPTVFITIAVFPELFLARHKKQALDAMYKVLADTGIPPERINIIFLDYSWHNWAVGGIFVGEHADHIPPLR